MNYQNWTNEQKARYILDKLKATDLPSSLLARIQGWLLSGDNDREKERLLQNVFDEIFDEQAGHRGVRAYRMLAEFKRRTEEVHPPVAKRIPLRRRMLLRVAAVLLPAAILAGSVFFWMNKPAQDPVEQVIVSVTDGSPEKIMLPDGTQVWVNQGTVLAYAKDFTKNRSLTLDGEAYFDVTKDERYPFTVQAGELTVTVLGTEFNVRAYADDARTIVSLAEGKVAVRDEGTTYELDPLQELTYDKATGQGEIAPFDPEALKRWIQQRVSLESVPLNEALTALGAFYGVEIEYTFDTSGRVVTIVLDEGMTLEETLGLMQFMIGGFRYEIDGDRVTLQK